MVNLIVSDDRNIYHTAAKNCIIEILLEANRYELNVRDDDGRTPIHYAALKGHLTALKVILSLGLENNFFFTKSISLFKIDKL